MMTAAPKIITPERRESSRVNRIWTRQRLGDDMLGHAEEKDQLRIEAMRDGSGSRLFPSLELRECEALRISFQSNAYVIDEENDEPVAAPQVLDGWTLADDRLENYLEDPLADLGVVGGEIRAVVGQDGQPYIVVDYWSPELLDDKALEMLEESTIGQLSDGMGENGFGFVCGGRRLLLMPALSLPLEVEQFDDGKSIPPPSRIAIAAREGDLVGLREALASNNADVDSPLVGYTGLHLALLYGHADAALLLIEHGVDVNKPDHIGGTPLDLCALSNSLSDEDSVRVARALLSKGADPTHVSETGDTPRSFAESRSKWSLVKLLSNLD